MKRNFWLAALVGVALTGCVNEEVIPEANQKEALKFAAPVIATQSRATVKGEITGVKYPSDETFQVFSKIYSGSYAGWNDSTEDYFAAHGDVAKHEGGTYWSTSTVYYWPDAGYNLAFAAYSPAELGEACTTAPTPTAITRTAAGIQITGFVSEPKSDDQYDLMYSHTVYDRNKSNNASQAVALKFEHALSSIVFSSQKSDAAVDYEITDLKVIGNFYTQGNFSQGITGATTDDVYTETETPQWDLSTGAGVTTNVYYDPSFDSFNVPDASPEIFTQGTSAILVIPQDVPSDAKVHVTYKKTTNRITDTEGEIIDAGTTTTHIAEIFLKDFKKAAAEGTTVADGIEAWERGKRYVYRIAFGENQRIYFEPSVNDWVPEPTLIYTIK